MVKKRNKRKISSKKKNLFSKNNLLVFGVIALFITCLILLAFVNKPTGLITDGSSDDPLQEAAQKTTSFIHDLFLKWEGGNLDTNIAKYVFFFMLVGLIWGALSFAQFPNNVAFQGLLALPAAFLATAYLTPTEVFVAMQSWNALGITLIFVLPFIIALLISSMLYSAGGARKMTVGKILIGLLLWTTLALVQCYKFIEGWVLGKLDFALLNLPLALSFVFTLITVSVLVFHNPFRMWMWRLGLEVRAMTGQLTSTELEQAKDAMVQVAQLHAEAKAAKAARKK